MTTYAVLFFCAVSAGTGLLLALGLCAANALGACADAIQDVQQELY